jgi:2-polyprenyl-6-methoxyphenol hydroxylase-like FAD-dependent oxidoreductase
MLRTLFGSWHEGVRQVLDGLREDGILRHDLYDLAPPLSTFVDGNVALIGDAAHAMTPDLGRGACEALVDGVTLGRCLVVAPGVRPGLAEYDRQRRRSVQRLARMSRTMGRVAHARRFTPLRDVAVRAALRLGPPA